jgi:hypothetical protein
MRFDIELNKKHKNLNSFEIITISYLNTCEEREK